MSKLDELIKELCPNGVEYKELKDICVIKKGVQLNKEKLLEEANYPVINGGILPSGYWNNYNVKEDTITISQGGASAGYVQYISTKFWAGAHCYYLELKDKNINYRYIYHFIKMKQDKLTSSQVGAGIPSVEKKVLENLLIPTPPLEVQNEIVRILDNFTALTADLTAELTARKKQYSWYRDYLLNFENKVEIVKLEDIAEVYDGTHQTPDYKKNGIPFVSVENIDNIYNTEKYISEEDYEKNYRIKPKIDDIFMTRIGTIGKCAIVTTNNPLAYYVSLALLRPNKNKIDSTYLKYIIESRIGKKELNKRILFTAVPIKINKGDIDKLEIPLPPLEVQKRIVEVLDNFEKICNDLNIGLPAEIEARQKQYEFFRNYLLTFNNEEIYALSKQAQNLIKILQYVYGYVEVRLGDIGKVSMCRRVLKSETNPIKGIPFFKIGTFGKKEDAYISIEKFYEYKEKYSYPKKGMILISTSGTIGRTVVFDGKPAYYQDSNIVWIDNNEEKVLNKYLYYFYQTNPWKIDTGGTIERLYNENIEKTSIPLPPLEEQQRIVDILDRFDKLCNDISEGLPAEIEIRQKQYEYYREKLLSFKKL